MPPVLVSAARSLLSISHLILSGSVLVRSTGGISVGVAFGVVKYFLGSSQNLVG